MVPLQGSWNWPGLSSPMGHERILRGGGVYELVGRDY